MSFKFILKCELKKFSCQVGNSATYCDLLENRLAALLKKTTNKKPKAGSCFTGFNIQHKIVLEI